MRTPAKRDSDLLHKLTNPRARSHLREVFFFGIVGVTATCTHYFCALVLVTILQFNVYVSNILGYLSAVMLSWFGHSFLSFRTAPSLERFKRFCLVSALTFSLSQGILFVAEDLFHWPAKYSLVVVVMSIPVISFVLNKFWVFRSIK